MGSHTFEILRQGIWASVTGGWFFDPRQHVFINTFHLYLWLFLLGIPLTLYLYFPVTEWAWGVYSFSVLLVMLSLKVVNYRLHLTFDTSECIEEQTRNDPPSVRENKPVFEVEEVEMDVLGPKRETETPPIACSSRNSFTGAEQRRRRPLDLAEVVIDPAPNPVAARMTVHYYQQYTPGATIEVDIHRNNTSNEELNSKTALQERVRQKSRKRSPPYNMHYKSNEGATSLTIDDVIIEDEVCGTESAHAGCSHPSLNSQPSQESNLGTSTSLSSTGAAATGGRYGNMSNLACSKGAGSLDFLYYHTPITAKNTSGVPKRVRRTKSALETCSTQSVCYPLVLPSNPVSLEGMSHPPQREPNQVCGATIDEEQHTREPLDSDEDYKGSLSPLLSRHKSLEHTQDPLGFYRPRAGVTSSLSLDKAVLKKRTQSAQVRDMCKSSNDSEKRILGSVPKPETHSSPTLSCSPCYAATSLSASTLTELLLSDSPSHQDSSSPHSPRKQNTTARDTSDSWSLYSSLGLNWLFEQQDYIPYPPIPEVEPVASTSQGSRSSSSDSSTNEAMRLLPDQQELGARPKRRTHVEEKPESMDLDLRSELVKIMSHRYSAEREVALNRLLERTQQLHETEMVEREASLPKPLTNSESTPKKRPKKLASCRRRAFQDSGELTRKRRRQSSGSSRSRDGTEPKLCALASMIAGPGTHLANSHDDTTEGAVHWFQDEHGNWLTYTFNEKSAGLASGVVPVANPLLINTLLGMQQGKNNESEEDESSSSGSASSGLTTIIIDNPAAVPAKPEDELTTTLVHSLDTSPSPLFVCPNMRVNTRSPLQLLADCIVERARPVPAVTRMDSELSNRLRFPEERTPKSRHYYKFWVLPFYFFKVYFDRLSLLALLDRNLTKREVIVTIFLAVMVAVLGSLLLERGLFHDLSVFVFCVVIASCQYSLLKSVQPDAASPTHGYNGVVAFSRPVYFCVLAISVLLLETSLSHQWYSNPFVLYGIEINSEGVIRVSMELLGWMLLFFPLIFTVGLLPQVNTFVMYLLEQLDIIAFGGNATVSLVSAVYCVGRSALAVGLLYGFAYFPLKEKESSQHLMFSIFCGILVSLSYHLSRSASDPSVLWTILKKHVLLEAQVVGQEEQQQQQQQPPPPAPPPPPEEKQDAEGVVDPLPEKLENTVISRLNSDSMVCIVIGVLVFAVHISTVFTALDPILYQVLWIGCSAFGLVIHYIIPQLRKQLPWLCFSHPFFKAKEYDSFEVKEAAKIMWFEKVYVCACFLERNIVYPLVIVSALTRDSPLIVDRFGMYVGTLMVVICGLKCLRCSYSDASPLFLVLLLTVLLFRYDLKGRSETFLIDFWLMMSVCSKLYELVLKVKFVITYIAPWQITWGSAFHAFAQPFSVPHSGMLFIQTIISSILSTPLNPFLGSAIFFTSYMRPIKFWERDYNTKRVDHTNTRLSAHIEKNPGADDNNLNSIFYEHLTRSLQHSLCGDLALGRWGNVGQGDCFVLASDNLNCLVHIVEMGNGLVTFQVRGLEFRGTYCQQREVEAISEGAEDDDGCCCCEPGHIPHMLSVNAAFNQRWLAWQLTQTTYVLEGYSISDNSAQSMLQVFDLRKILVSYYVKAIIYYTLRSGKLEEWLQSEVIAEALSITLEKGFADLDPVFSIHIDEDVDFRATGISRNSFCNVYWDWLQYCASREKRELDCAKDSMLVSLCLSLSLLGRRTLASSSHNPMTSVDLFLHGLHQLFKGVFDTSSARDEWVYCDMDLVKRVIIPAVRMALKLHQDHFTFHDEYEDNERLYDAICNHEETLVIAHEGNPAWRSAVLAGRQSLLALRHVSDDGAEEYKVIMLNKRWLSFRVIKLNRECVRGLWAGQQQELIFLRNRNPERGSIQNAKQALRNMINSSCDQPIGYPIYVSPLTTSYADTSQQLCSIVGGPASFSAIKNFVVRTWTRLRIRCGESCSSGGSVPHLEPGFSDAYVRNNITSGITAGGTIGSHHSVDSSVGGSLGRGCSLGRQSGSYNVTAPPPNKPSSSTIASLAGLLNSSETQNNNSVPPVKQVVKIVDVSQVYDNLNGGRRIDPLWPDDRMRVRGGRAQWNNWFPEAGMEGWVVHRWVPFHRDPTKRSNLDKVILLLQIGDRYVPIAETGVLTENEG